MLKLMALVLSLMVGQVALADDAAANVGSLSGSVTSQDGAVVADCPVKLFAPKAAGKIAYADGAGRMPGVEAIASATTDKDGNFKMENVPAGTYTVVAGDALKGIGRGKAVVVAGKNAELKLTILKRRRG